jgi:PadR family transcriptional regulator PadR
VPRCARGARRVALLHDDGEDTALKEDAGGKIVRDVFLAFVRVHVLHHAALGRTFGAEMMEELKRHGYDISPGTLYPMLHALEGAGLLASTAEVVDGKGRRYYRTTKAGDSLLRQLRARIGELVDEVLEGRTRVRRR